MIHVARVQQQQQPSSNNNIYVVQQFCNNAFQEIDQNTILMNGIDDECDTKEHEMNCSHTDSC